MVGRYDMMEHVDREFVGDGGWAAMEKNSI